MHENGAIFTMQGINGSEDRQLIVAQEPRISVNFRGENQLSAERLVEEIVLKVFRTRGDAHAVILRQPLQTGDVAACKRKFPVVHGGFRIADVDIDVGFRAVPEKGGGVRFADAKGQTMVQNDEIGGIFAAFLHRLYEFCLFFLPQPAAYAVELEKREVIIAAQGHKQLLPFRLRFGIVAVAIGTAPDAESAADLRRRVRDRSITVWILFCERIHALRRVQTAGAVQISGVPGVNVELHPEPVSHEFEKFQICERLRFRGTLVCAVDPAEILCSRRRQLVRAGGFFEFLHRIPLKRE